MMPVPIVLEISRFHAFDVENRNSSVLIPCVGPLGLLESSSGN